MRSKEILYGCIALITAMIACRSTTSEAPTPVISKPTQPPIIYPATPTIAVVIVTPSEEINAVTQENIDTPYSQGTLDVPQTWTMDLDKGVVGADKYKVDVWFEAETKTERYLTPRNGAKIAIFGSTAPILSDCQSALLSEDRINVDDITVGFYLCVLTNEGRYSQLLLKSEIGPSPGTFSADYVTW